MKNLLLLLAFYMAATTMHAQFPGNQPELLKGKEVKPIVIKEEIFQSSGYKNFFTTEAMGYKDHYSPLNFGSKYESLVGKVFNVIEVTPYKNSIDSQRFRITLVNPEIGTLYYDYDPQYDFSYELEVVGGLKMPAGFYCKDLEKESDKFTGEVTVSSPILDGISFIKVTKNKVSTMYMSIRANGSTAVAGKKGLTILFENGKKLVKPAEKIALDAGGSGYVYTAFITLTAADIKLLKENRMTDARLYIFDSEIAEGIRLQEYLKCITGK